MQEEKNIGRLVIVGAAFSLRHLGRIVFEGRWRIGGIFAAPGACPPVNRDCGRSCIDRAIAKNDSRPPQGVIRFPRRRLLWLELRFREERGESTESRF